MTDTALKVNVKELRIGNWVQRTLGAVEHLKVLGVDSEKEMILIRDGWGGIGVGVDYSEAKPRWVLADDIEPIPLTPEILEKAGFVGAIVTDSEGKEIHQINFTLFNNTRNITVSLVGGLFVINEGTVIECEIKFVHQLQNLYFALTGEELNIDL